MFEENNDKLKKKPLRKITKVRIKNIALYYLKRFDSSVENLRQVLRRRVNDYVYYNPDFDKEQGYAWIEEVLHEFEGYGYLNDERYAEIKVRGYLSAGKSERYILGKMREKGILEDLVEKLLGEQEYDVFEMAMRLAKKKKIGPFRVTGDRKEFWQKDAAKLVTAGFEYEVVKQVLGYEGEE